MVKTQSNESVGGADRAMILRCRSIDFHERNNWAIIWVLLDTCDEAYVYREFSPSPIRTTTDAIVESMVDMSEMEEYRFNLIDPLAGKNQTNSRTSAIEDINNKLRSMYNENRSSRGVFEPFDTKGTHGRAMIRTRLHNSMVAGKPGNNLTVVEGREVLIPTLWISDQCPQTATSLRNWRYEEWTGNSASMKDRKEAPIQKYSHFCTALEGVMKDSRFKVPRVRMKYRPPNLFKGRR